MFGTEWHVFLRDILIMVAAGALLVTLLFLALVGWQVYRLAKDLRREVQPLLVAIQDTADTVRDTTGFVANKLVLPTADAVGGVAHRSGVLSLVRKLYGLV